MRPANSIAGLPSLSASEYMDPLLAASRSLKGLLQRRVTGYISEKNLYWHTLLGLLISGRQCFVALCFLVADDRGKETESGRSPGPFPLGAATLNRSLLELLGNVLCLVEEPVPRARALAQDAYRERHKALVRIERSVLATIPKWQAWIRNERAEVKQLANFLKLSEEERHDPVHRLPSWPSSDGILKGKAGVPYLSSDRHRIFEILMESWYAEQSRVAHQKDAAIRLAFRAENATKEDFIALRNDTTWSAALFFLCILSEMEIARDWPPGPISDLRRAWRALEVAADQIVEVYSLRYRSYF